MNSNGKYDYCATSYRFDARLFFNNHPYPKRTNYSFYKKNRLTSSAGINLGAIVTRTKGIATHIIHIKGCYIKQGQQERMFQ
jgi:hypothetical protein